MKRRHQTKFILLGCWAWIMLNIPILMVADSSKLVLGFPFFYAYLFVVWLILIVGVAISVKKYVS